MSAERENRLPYIAVIDSSPDRGASIVVALRSAGSHPYQFRLKMDESVSAERLLPEAKVKEPVEWDLFLIHGTDAKTFVNHCRDIGEKIEGVREIYYSGSGGHDETIPFGAEKIMRALLDGFTPDEAAQLVRAARNRNYPPAITLPSAPLSILRSLSVLCAVYLSVQAAKREVPRVAANQEVSDEMGKALNALGWNSIPNELRMKLCNEHDGLVSHAGEVERSGWWIERMPVALRSDLHKHVERELAILTLRQIALDERPVLELVECLAREANECLPGEIVLAGYSVLASIKEM